MAGFIGLTMLAVTSLGGSNDQEGIMDRQYALVKPGQTISGKAVVAQPDELTIQGQVTTATTVERTGQQVIEVPAISEFQFGNRGVREVRTLSGTPLASLQKLKGMDKKVSLNLENKTASDALRWLSKQGVNFVVNVNELPSQKLTLNLKNVPLHESLTTIAEVLGGRWEVRGSTLIFKKGGAFAFGSSMGGRALSVPGFQSFDHDDFVKGFDVEAFKSFDSKKFEDWGKLQPKDMNDKALVEKWMKAMPQFEMKEFRLGNPGGRVSDTRVIKGKAAPAEKGIQIKVSGKDILSSITKDQWGLHEKQGFLKISQLSSEQLKSLGISVAGEGQISIQIESDGKKLTIKSDK